MRLRRIVLYAAAMLRLLVIAFALLAAPASASVPMLGRGERAIETSLLAESYAPRAGGTVTAIIRMRPRPGWHGYWSNPGDAGLPPTFAWRLPPGVRAGIPLFPVPTRLLIAGLMNHVFKGEYAILVPISVPPQSASAVSVPLNAHLRYLACTDAICVPEEADVAINLPIAYATSSPTPSRYRAALPQPLGAPARFEHRDGTLRLAIPLLAGLALDDPWFFPFDQHAIDHATPQRISRRGDTIIVETAASARPSALAGVLAFGNGRGVSLSAVPGEVGAAGVPIVKAARPTPQPGPGLPLAIAGALLGGLLLNLMPCVFPILSLKALSLAKAGGDQAAARRDALAYTAGAVATCTALGALLLALRAGGASVGWAFQLQHPGVILFLLLLTLLIALNLAGRFALPAFAGGDSLASKPGAAGAFWTGGLAAFVATPCTGPFLGAAMGAALVLPGPAAIAIFAALGLGLSLPFLALGLVPALRRRLPKPGPWMERFRHWLSIPMFLTAVGLLWILWRQAGGVALAFALLVGAVVALIVTRARSRGLLVAGALALGGIAGIILLPQKAPPTEPALRGAEPFSEARLAALRAEGRPVFVYFTADWCLTCKVNERLFDTPAVRGAFADANVAVLVGDWTRGDAGIGAFLEKHGRSGVPLYLFYPARSEARILPQILTASTLVSAARP